jgi:hypothetical protein
MEAAHKTALAKGELGIIERQPAPTLKKFAEDSFLPYIASTFSKKPKTKEYYEYGARCLLAFEKLATAGSIPSRVKPSVHMSPPVKLLETKSRR